MKCTVKMNIGECKNEAIEKWTNIPGMSYSDPGYDDLVIFYFCEEHVNESRKHFLDLVKDKVDEFIQQCYEIEKL